MRISFYVNVSILLLITIFFVSCEKGASKNIQKSQNQNTDKAVATNTEIGTSYNTVPDNVQFVFVSATNTGLDNYNFKGLMLLKIRGWHG